MAITPEQYFQAKPHTAEQVGCALELLSKVNYLFYKLGYEPKTCPNTGTQISGSKGGSGDGGFRLPTATTGAQNSSHKEAKGVDVYDPDNWLDDHITDELLEECGLYREHPDSTPGWCHLTTRAPRSGMRTFFPTTAAAQAYAEKHKKG